MELRTLLEFAVWAFLLALAPGPDIVFVLSESLAKGARAGLSISLGLVSGVTVHTLLCATGVSILVAASPAAFLAVKFFGAAYLLWLACGAFMERPEAPDVRARGAGGPKGFAKYFSRGFIMNVSNPKVLIFFVAVLPGKVSQTADFSAPLQIVVLGLIFMLMALAVFACVSLAGGFFAGLFASPRFWRAMRVMRILVFAGLAASILATSIS